MVHAEFHHSVDRFSGANAFLEGKDRLIDHRAQDAIRDESRGIHSFHRFLTHLSSDLNDCLSRLIGCRKSADNLKQLHQGDRVKEMHPDHFIGAFCGGTDLGQGNG